VAATGGFDAALAAADLVLTGEGRLDATSLDGKVVGEVLRRNGALNPVHVVVGSADPAVAAELRARGVGVTVLADRFGLDAALARTLDLLAEVVPEVIRSAAGSRPVEAEPDDLADPGLLHTP
jgi:glycerate 2-kinase